jgi:hypothetical protein
MELLVVRVNVRRQITELSIMSGQVLLPLFSKAMS